MKVVSWNIERGYRPEETCRALAELEADVYLLTELDRGNGRTKGVDMFELIGRSLGLEGRYAREFEELDSVWRRVLPLGGLGGGVHGNAVFARAPLLDYRELPLPTADPLHWRGETVVPELFEPRRGGRKAQLFELEVGGRPVSFINIHLENWRCGWPLRRRQLEAALAAAKAPELVLAGDMNCLEGIVGTFFGTAVNREVRFLREFLGGRGLADPWADTAYTNFNYGTRSKLDWLCVSAGLELTGPENRRTGLSDHNCLSARLRVRAS